MIKINKELVFDRLAFFRVIVSFAARLLLLSKQSYAPKVWVSAQELSDSFSRLSALQEIDTSYSI